MLKSALHLDFIPQLEAAHPEALQGAAVAVIDLLRATTTITAALQAGCRRVIPCATVPAAERLAKQLRQRGEAVVLAGERGGVKIPGFDQGNSPSEFNLRSRFRGRSVILTTSNGTRALERAKAARLGIAACLNNARASARILANFYGNRAVLLASGESGEPAEEDTLAAGLLIGLLLKTGRKLRMTPLAETVWRMAQVVGNAKFTEKFIRSTPHGQDLLKLGFQSDLRSAAKMDTTGVVGVMTREGITPFYR